MVGHHNLTRYHPTLILVKDDSNVTPLLRVEWPCFYY